jgi:hypothetical protein
LKKLKIKFILNSHYSRPFSGYEDIIFNSFLKDYKITSSKKLGLTEKILFLKVKLLLFELLLPFILLSKI